MNEIATSGGAPSFNLDDYATDAQKELQGVWRNIGKDKNGKTREVKLARESNENYMSALRVLQRKNQALLEMNDDEAFSLAEEIARECYSKHILKGLRVDGVEMSKTPDEYREMLKNKDFFAKIRTLAGQMDSYKIEDEQSVKS